MEDSFELHEWELLQGPDAPAPAPAPTHVAGIPENATHGTDSDDGIEPDYFALDSGRCYAERLDLEHSDARSDSDKPSWVDPDELGGGGLASAGFWTSEESSDERNSPKRRESSDLGPEGCSNLMPCVDVEAEADAEAAMGVVHGSAGSGDKSTEIGRPGDVVVGSGRKDAAWWKLPLELLKFCVVKIRPVWPIPVAAALLGFVVLGRKLYNMRRRSRSLPSKLTIDDKKASLFAVQAARLNEAFSVVKRMPITRPPFQPAGVTPWPVLALR